MKNTQLTRLAAVATGAATCAAAYATVCYGISETVTIKIPNGNYVSMSCKDLPPAPDGAVYGEKTCFYVFCNTAENCSGGRPDSQAWKRFREVWVQSSFPYLCTKNAPSDVPYGCCTCSPGYTQTVSPGEE